MAINHAEVTMNTQGTGPTAHGDACHSRFSLGISDGPSDVSDIEEDSESNEGHSLFLSRCLLLLACCVLALT